MPSSIPRLILLAAMTPLAACGSLSPGRVAGVPAHFTSHQLCSAAFVGGMDPDQFYREAIAPAIAPVGPLVRYAVDRERREVTVSVGGVVESRAVWRGPLGCQVAQGTPLSAIPVLPPPGPALLPPIAGPAVVEPADPALKAALDHAFEEPASGPHRNTKAVVIVKDGKVVAERYAPSVSVDTPMHGWSMSKSVTNALIGILVRQGRLDMAAPAPAPAWAGPNDPHHAITPDNLLRMESGLDFGQSMTADWTLLFDPTAQMVYAQPDMAGFAEQARMKAAPGASFTYQNGNTLILSAILRDRVGGDAASVLRFAHTELLDKLGMTRTTLEFDAAGTPIGSSHYWATARDWARFGLLYANDGVVGGERILPAGWTDYSARPTPEGAFFGYGAGFWTNRGTGFGARTRTEGGMPADSYFARGNWGQYVVVVPSAHLVVVRLGPAYTHYGDIDAVNRLVKEAVAATKAG